MAKSLLSLKEQLEDNSGKKFEFKINNNRSTMLSVRWEPDRTLVSMHKMFLDAPKNVMEDLACYVRRESDSPSLAMRAFMEDGCKKLDFSHTLDKRKIDVAGKVYNLQHLYDDINREFFENRLQLAITWFGKHIQKNRSKINFGLYYDTLKLIKINRIMDSVYFPEYVVKFVIYHEMLHHVCPSYYDKKGLHRIHTKEFKAQEKNYHHFNAAQAWIKEHTADLFANYDS